MPLTEPDFYQVLGVSKDADSGKIRHAYRKLAMKYHPDRNPDDKEASDRFKAVSEAYDVLKDAQKKQMYDAGGHSFGNGANRADFSDIFGDWLNQFDSVFSGGRSQSRSRNRREMPIPGDDMEYVLEIDLEDAVSGVRKEISFNAPILCDRCEGKGHEADGGPQACLHCDGTGAQQSKQGILFMSQTCRHCGGAGSVIRDPCGACGGHGLTSKRRALNVDVPAGIDYGQSLRLMEQGGAGVRGGPPGDLYVRIKVREHEMFTREQNDLLVEIPLSFVQVSLGDKIRIEAPGGAILLTIPAGIESGQVLRVAGQGVTSLHGGGRKGDLLCRIRVRTPQSLTDEQREKLRMFDESMPQDGQSETWLERIGAFFNRARG